MKAALCERMDDRMIPTARAWCVCMDKMSLCVDFNKVTECEETSSERSSNLPQMTRLMEEPVPALRLATVVLMLLHAPKDGGSHTQFSQDHPS